MRVHRNGLRMNVRRLRTPGLWLVLLTALCLLAFTARMGERVVAAQVSPLPSTSTGQLGISPEEPVAPPQPIIVKVPAQSAPKATNAPSAAKQNIQPAAKTEMPVIPDPDPNNPVAVQSANLLKMAYSLKLEVDKTSKDMLSVSVVRRAAEIEQAAHKMRTK